MDDLIKALQIIKKYADDTRWPTHCEHDVLYVNCVPEEKFEEITKEDEKELENLGFFFRDDDGSYTEYIMSYRYGSS